VPIDMERRRFLGGALLLGASGLAASVPVRALAEGAQLRREGATFRVPGLDPAHDGLRVAQLSDLHVGARTRPEVIRAAIDLANAARPDIVVLTGDYVCHDRRDVAKLRTQLAGLEAPTFAVLGNHDVWTDPAGVTAALRGNGYEVLDNAWSSVEVRGAPLALVGVGDHLTGHEDVARATTGLPRRSAPLVLAHGPRTANRLRALGRPLVCLSGHTHGGQINVPFLTPLVLAGLVGEPYVRGHYRLGDVQLYVNRGVGMSGIRVRVNSPPEVTLVTLRAA
jgi:predicted MPP superfamily phosphohydrolase